MLRSHVPSDVRVWGIRRRRSVGGHHETCRAKKRGLISHLQVQALRRVKQIKNNTASAELKRFQEMIALFHKYGEKYNFDPLLLAAQGYQESQLNQNAKSPVGLSA